MGATYGHVCFEGCDKLWETSDVVEQNVDGLELFGVVSLDEPPDD